MDGLLWFSDGALERISGVEPDSGDVVRVVPCPGVTTGLTSLYGNLVQVIGAERTLRVINVDTGDAVDELPNPRPGSDLCGIEAGPEGIWLGYEDLRLLDFRDVADLRLLNSIEVSGRVAGVTIANGCPIYADYHAATVTRVDPIRNVEGPPMTVAGRPTGLTFDDTRLWYCDYSRSQLHAVRIPDDPANTSPL
jgi:hypothetical protein